MVSRISARNRGLLVYWALFGYFAFGAFMDSRRPPDFSRQRPAFVLGGILIVALVGLRYKVGADWEQYQFIFSYAGHVGFSRALTIGDPGYEVLNWTVQSLGGRIVWVNLVCGILFTWGLLRLARVQPYPWLAVLVAIPYMVIVVSSYTRQAAALGILMAGLAALARGGSLARFVIYVGLAALFHRTAVAILPLVIFSRPSNRLLNVVGGLVAFYALFDLFLADSMDEFVSGYIQRQYNSQGAAIRIAMEALAAGLFVMRRKAFGFTKAEDSMWFYFAMASFAAVGFLMVSPSSTAVDRLSLYLLPLQLVILSRIPLTYASRNLGLGLVVAYSFAVQFVWLNFAVHAQYWLPYQFYPMFK